MRLNAFTLIEMLIALALSAAIMLIAFSAFRMCASSIQTMNRMVTENDLMRRGAVLALDAIDSWSDYAEPSYPWGKTFNGFSNVSIAGAPVVAAEQDNANNKRSFRLVTFDAAGNFNPNWVQPHDPRSWYRNHLSQSPRPYVANTGNGTMYWPNALYGGGPYSGNWNVNTSDIPPGWEARHIWGDYSLVSNTAMDPTSDIRGARPRLMLDLYVKLGEIGVVNYMPAGTQSLILQPSTNLANRVASPTDPQYSYNIGEVPFVTANKNSHSGGTATTVTFTGLAGAPSSVTGGSVGVNTNNFNRCNYYEGIGGNNDSMSRTWGFDFDQLFDRYLLWGNVYTNDGTNWSPGLLHQAIRSPWQRYNAQTNNWDVPAVQDQWIRDYGNVLYLIPQTYANNPQPNLSQRPRNMPALSMSTLRFRWRSGEFHNTVLRLVNPETGTVMQMGIYATGTTYRGARQRWALNTDDASTGAFDPTMGDQYQ